MREISQLTAASVAVSKGSACLIIMTDTSYTAGRKGHNYISERTIIRLLW